MNQFIMSQCKTMQQTIKAFKESCEFAATRDDGKISKDETKTLKMITKASDAFAKELEKIIKSE